MNDELKWFETLIEFHIQFGSLVKYLYYHKKWSNRDTLVINHGHKNDISRSQGIFINVILIQQNINRTDISIKKLCK